MERWEVVEAEWEEKEVVVDEAGVKEGAWGRGRGGGARGGDGGGEGKGGDADAILTLPLRTEVTSTSSEVTPAELASCAWKSGKKDKLKSGEAKVEISKEENVAVEETPCTVTIPGGGEGGGGLGGLEMVKGWGGELGGGGRGGGAK
ncbi:hypothetical protein CYMTET_42693 [Cymbomonas tetramitiformis]|uniref:Uncharacterized protein n=1 Tax=Cymbomonas tetramitiformis TaxID=36881 RepID=A0AAE0F0R1_9CHLO|nr:hypothetical protein CYMTET_42693 [Cymbomonas tetramitiformis]